MPSPYQSFRFTSYHWDPKRRLVELSYALDDRINFTERIQLSRDFPLAETADGEGVERALLALHLIGGISYYKTYLPSKLILESGSLTAEQARFWEMVYANGLGEFFYRNQIDFRGLVRFPHEDSVKRDSYSFRPPQPSVVRGGQGPEKEEAGFYLLPFGGGKDSIVAAELLKKAGIKPVLFRQNASLIIDQLAEVTELPLMTVGRQLDPGLFDLNAQGALNGHVPITAYISFLSILVSLLYGFKGVVMSNERGATEGNVEYLGLEINHQWSKGRDFEAALQSYLEKYISRRVAYLNPLRVLSELRIVQLFTDYPRYFPLVTSCNANWKQRADPETKQPLWCGHCPKCAFIFLLLTAFLPLSEVEKLFGANLLAREELRPMYQQLLGLKDFKPFECVGTVEECQAAFLLASKQPEVAATLIGGWFEREVKPGIQSPEELIERVLAPEGAEGQPAVSQEILRKNALI